jgi:TIR domain
LPRGPSILDHRTLAQSGPLPLAFLRGCGLPDPLIDSLPSLRKQALSFASCFISYSTKDQDFAEKLHADLQDKGIRCWLMPHHGQGGKKRPEPVDVVMRPDDPLLLIVSERSMESEWIKTEMAEAREQERREQRRMLFPVRLVGLEAWRDWECLDSDTGQEAARGVREYDVPDFSRWQNDHSYQTELKRLVRELKAEKHRAFSAT